jgi:hypothetical protein
MFKKIGAILQSLKASKKEVEEAYESVYDNANKCVHCGAVIPEGGLSCPNCERGKDE